MMKYAGLVISLFCLVFISPTYAGFFDDGRDYMASGEWMEWNNFEVEGLTELYDKDSRLNFTALGWITEESSTSIYASKWRFNLDESFQIQVSAHYDHDAVEETDFGSVGFAVYGYNQEGNLLHFDVGSSNGYNYDSVSEQYVASDLYWAGYGNASEGTDKLDEYWVRTTTDADLFITYNAIGNGTLVLSAGGQDIVIDDIRTEFDLDEFGVVFEGWSEGAGLAEGDAYLYSFNINQVNPVVTPEPVSSLLFVLGGAGLIARKMRK
jgi:hypothetical protein